MYYKFFPQQIDTKPPTLYKILDSICNGSYDVCDIWDNDEPVKIYELAENARTMIFRYNYPLSVNVSRETFETQILNHFLMRRIGYETVTGFIISLGTKLNEIMPKYNLLFDIFAKQLDLLQDDRRERYTQKTDNTSVNNGEWQTVNNGGYDTKQTGDYKTDINGNYQTGVQGNYQTDKNGAFNEVTDDHNVEDLRNSDTPQNRLGDVQAGEYVSEYNYNTRDNLETKDNTHTDTETNTHTDTTDNTHTDTTVNEHQDTTKNTHTDTDENTYTDTDVFDGLINFDKTITDVSDKIDKLLRLQEELTNIMTMIYNDLEPLFYQIID